jgi:regulator of protease activity HflC (stomatin/prohibitin superfamily)
VLWKVKPNHVGDFLFNVQAPEATVKAVGESAMRAVIGRSNTEAKGQASRFSQVYEQYHKAPDVTRQRIYLETMERILGGTDKTIIDTGAQPGPGGGMAPYLPLTSLPREQQQPAGGN